MLEKISELSDEQTLGSLVWRFWPGAVAEPLGAGDSDDVPVRGCPVGFSFSMCVKVFAFCIVSQRSLLLLNKNGNFLDSKLFTQNTWSLGSALVCCCGGFGMAGQKGAAECGTNGSSDCCCLQDKQTFWMWLGLS